MTAVAPRPRSADASDVALVDAAMDGDELAWTWLTGRHQSAVRAVAHARLRDSHAAEDVVQETFVRAWTRLHQLEDPDRLGAWLKTIAGRIAVDHVRRRREQTLDHDRGIEHDDRDRVLTTPLEDHVVEREEASVLHGHLAALRDTDRVALWQRDALGVSVGELAEQLEMTPGSVRVLLTRARKRVRAGYTAVVVPVLGLAGRLRERVNALADSLPVAIAAPALVVATVAGIVVVDGQSTADDPGTAGGTETTVVEPAVAVDPSAPAVAPVGAEPPAAAMARGATTAPAAPAAAPTPAPAQRVGGPAGSGVTLGDPAAEQEDDDVQGDTTNPVGGIDGIGLTFDQVEDELGSETPLEPSCLGLDC